MNDSPSTEDAASAAAAAPPSRPAHPYRAFAIRAGLGFTIVTALLWRYDARPIFRTLARERAGCFAAAIAFYLASQVLSAYRWQLLAAILRVHGRYRDFLAYLFVGMFTNLFVPGLLAGDAARAVYLGRRRGRMGEAIASVVADRAVGLLGLLWLAAIAAIFLNSAAIPSSIVTPTVAVGAIAMAGFFLSPLVARLIHLMPRPVRRAGGIVAPYLHHPAALVVPIALSIAVQIALAASQYILAIGLGMTVPLSLFILCVPIANVFASLPLTLNGLGIRESAYLVLFGMAGMRKEDAIALGLLWFSATLLGGMTGAIAFVTTPAPVGEG